MINIKLAQNPTSHMKTDTRQVMLLVSLEAAQNKHIYIYIYIYGTRFVVFGLMDF